MRSGPQMIGVSVGVVLHSCPRSSTGCFETTLDDSRDLGYTPHVAQNTGRAGSVAGGWHARSRKDVDAARADVTDQTRVGAHTVDRRGVTLRPWSRFPNSSVTTISGSDSGTRARPVRFEGPRLQ